MVAMPIHVYGKKTDCENICIKKCRQTFNCGFTMTLCLPKMIKHGSHRLEKRAYLKSP